MTETETETTIETILEMNSKELAKILATTLEYTNKSCGIIYNNIFVSDAYIAASDGHAMALTTLNKETMSKYAIVDGNDIKIILSALEALNKTDKYGFTVTLRTNKINSIGSFTVADKYNAIKFLYHAKIDDRIPPKYNEILPENKKVLGIFSRKSLLKAMAEIKGKYNKTTKRVYLSENNISATLDDVETIMPIECVQFDEYTQAVSFNYDYLIKLIKTSNQEGFLVYTDKNAEKTIKSPVWLEEGKTLAVIMPLAGYRD
jgi:predicted transcriptional regulator